MTRLDPKQLGGAEVLALLTEAGHQAFVVGGPVRNALLGAPVSDVDIATDARPDRVLELAQAAGIKAVPTGIDHGTVTLVIKGEGVEVTTFRRDVATDGRRAVVAFADTMAEDALRRDFTMNALYADKDGQVFDPLGGLPDLHARRFRFIEDPAQRIHEDYLRILRFFRFFAWYGDGDAGLDADGLAACAAHSDGLAQLSAERIGAEMLKLLAAPNPSQAVAAMAQSGVLAQVLPGAEATALPILVHFEGDRRPRPLRRLAALGGQDVAERLKLSKVQTKTLNALHTGIAEQTPAPEFAYHHGADLAEDLLLLRGALFQSPAPDAAFDEARAGAEARFPLRAADLPHLSGPALGKALKEAEHAWIASGFALTKADLLQAKT